MAGRFGSVAEPFFGVKRKVGAVFLRHHRPCGGFARRNIVCTVAIRSESRKEHWMIPANAAPLAIALLGLLLGMRHATDPDHVIAVTTILSRERRLAVAARIGIVWGLGHTVTVLLVGAAI